jgi:hypothetical protein
MTVKLRGLVFVAKCSATAAAAVLPRQPAGFARVPFARGRTRTASSAAVPLTASLRTAGPDVAPMTPRRCAVILR